MNKENFPAKGRKKDPFTLGVVGQPHCTTDFRHVSGGETRSFVVLQIESVQFVATQPDHMPPCWVVHDFGDRRRKGDKTLGHGAARREVSVQSIFWQA